jgi:hypothetical protein
MLGIVANEGWIDGVRQRDAGILSVGIHQWSAHAAKELPSLLFRFKHADPDGFDLHLRLHGLDVDEDPAHPGQYRLLALSDRDVATPMPEGLARRPFFGGSLEGGEWHFTAVWAARFRLLALVSASYRRCQLLEAVGRFDRILRDVGCITSAGTRYRTNHLISSAFGAALLLDSHINGPDNVHHQLQLAADQAGAQPTDDARDRNISSKYHDLRLSTTNDLRTKRNKGVDNIPHPFDEAHGSFSGWNTAPASVSGLVPAKGPPAGGTAITINGCGFPGTTAVRFGAHDATSVVVTSDAQIHATSPAGAGQVYVTVVGPAGTSFANAAARFTYG